MNEIALLRIAAAAKAALPIGSLRALVIVAAVAECPDQTGTEYCRLTGFARSTVYCHLLHLSRESAPGCGPLVQRIPGIPNVSENIYRLSPEGHAVVQDMLGALDGRPNGARGALPWRSPVTAEIQL